MQIGHLIQNRFHLLFYVLKLIQMTLHCLFETALQGHDRRDEGGPEKVKIQ